MEFELEKRYERLVNFLTDYIYTVKIRDSEVIDTYHGPGCVNVTGYTSDDYKKDPALWHRMVHEQDSDMVLDQAERARAGEDVPPIEHRIIHRDGSIRWVKNSIVVTRDWDGRPIYYDGLINNITNLKEAEEADALSRQQLIQADKMASLGILISGIAHEINNPNNFILLNIQLFQKIWKDAGHILQEYYKENGDFVLAGMLYSRASEKINQSLDGILTGSERIEKIVSSLKDYTKLDSGKFDEDVDINRVVEMSITITGSLIKKSTSGFKVEYEKGIPYAKGNPQQLEQVVINLITNACQSLKNKKSPVKVITSYDKKNKQAKITVKDEGVGIKESDIKYIMDPFFTTKRDMGGTGLGLSISYNIVKSHGGKLTLESKPDEGTTAEVSLPVPQKNN